MAAYSTYTDQELTALLLQDDEAAYTEIYNRYWEELLKSAYRILKDRDACMDVLQEVFVWLWTHRDSLVLNSIKAYLLTAVKYQVANFIRSSRVREAYVQHTALLQPDEAYEDDLLEMKELKAMIAHCTATLPGRCQQVFNLSRNENLSNREIATRLGISEKTVEMQMTIALKRLREKVKGHSAFLGFFL
jgi:RNA polymerase sigma-70 factor (family 1)